MAKERYPETTAALEHAVEKLDLNGVLYRLAQIAVRKRDNADDNPAEAKFWQAAIGILHDACDKVGEL